MKKIFNQILDFPQMVNQKIFSAKLNSIVDDFNSENGIRCWVKSIYQIAAVLVFVGMECLLVRSALDYFGGESGAMAKLGSALVFILLAYSAFPIASVIRSRGDSLGGTHKGMMEFLFKDLVLVNIRIVGEVAAIVALFAAFNLTLSFAFNADLMADPSGNVVATLSGFYAFPMATINHLLSMFNDGGLITSLIGLVDGFGSGSAVIEGWSWAGFWVLTSAYIQVLIVLAMLYINLAIYKYIYSIAAAIIDWVPRMSIPLSISNNK